MPLQFDNDTIVYPFILDSGGSNLLFDNFPDQKRFPFSFFSISVDAGGNISFPMIRKTNRIKMGAVEFSDLRFETAPFDWACYDHVYGILGKEAMRHLAWQIDFENQQIVVSGSIKKLTVSPKSEKVKLSENRFSHHLYLRLLTSDSVSNTFIFDIGNNGALSIKKGNKKFDNAISDSVRIIGTSSQGLTGTSKSEEWIVNYPTLQLGSSLQLKNVWADRSASGLDLFGIEILNRFLISFDWVDKILYLEPKKELVGFCDSYLGFSMNYKNGQTKITSVVENSTAYFSGIRPDQKVISVNGIKLENEDDFCNFKISEVDSVTLVVVGEEGCELKVTCERELLDNLKKKTE